MGDDFCFYILRFFPKCYIPGFVSLLPLIEKYGKTFAQIHGLFGKRQKQKKILHHEHITNAQAN